MLEKSDDVDVNKNFSYVLHITYLKPVLDNSAISSPKNQQADVSIALEIDSPWENFISPGPAVISLLGHLMSVSSKTDFSLASKAPANGFKYIRHPNSFRSTLIQVSNDGWGAFMNAHKNMDQVQLYMQQIPDHVKRALKIIFDASDKLVISLLPMTLGYIQGIGEECVRLCAETETKFNDVMLLLGEILECTQEAYGIYDEKYRFAQIELNASATQKQYLEGIGENLKKRQVAIDAQVTKYQDAYDKAMKAIPDEWTSIGQDFVRGLLTSIINITNEKLVKPAVLSKAQKNSE